MSFFPQLYLGARSSRFSRIDVFAHLPFPKLTYSWAWELGHIQFRACFQLSTLVPPTRGVCTSWAWGPGSPVFLGGKGSQHKPWSGLRALLFLPGAQPTGAAEDLDFKYSPLEEES